MTNLNGIEKNRIIYVNGDFDEECVQNTVLTMLDYECDDPTKDILMFIDSFGGFYDSFIAIHDAMQICRCDVATICVGKAMSCGQMLLMSGKNGKRFITPNSRIMMHQIHYDYAGNVSQMENELQQSKECQKIMEDLIIKYTHIKKPMLKDIMSRETYLSAKQALEFGLVDYIVENPKALYAKLKL